MSLLFRQGTFFPVGGATLETLNIFHVVFFLLRKKNDEWISWPLLVAFYQYISYLEQATSKGRKSI